MADRRLELLNFATYQASAWWAKLSRIHPRAGSIPTVEISKRLKTCAGKMDVWKRHMVLCYDLIDLYPDTFSSDTIPHELAHQVAFDVHGIGKDLEAKRIPWHGTEWAAIMGSIGLDPAMYHNMTNPRHARR